MTSKSAFSPEAYQSSQKEFIARGLDSRDRARKSGCYFSAKRVLMEMDEMLRSQGPNKLRGNNQ